MRISGTEPSSVKHRNNSDHYIRIIQVTSEDILQITNGVSNSN